MRIYRYMYVYFVCVRVEQLKLLLWDHSCRSKYQPPAQTLITTTENVMQIGAC